MEATAILREMLRAYDLRPDRSRPEHPMSRNITLAPSRGARVIVTPR
jgi:cytochrome P450